MMFRRIGEDEYIDIEVHYVVIIVNKSCFSNIIYGNETDITERWVVQLQEWYRYYCKYYIYQHYCVMIHSISVPLVRYSKVGTLKCFNSAITVHVQDNVYSRRIST